MNKFKLSISISFVVLIAIIFLSGLNPTVISALIASVLHEFGHIVAVILLDGRIDGIRLKAFAAEIIIDERQFSFKGEALISLCGPLMNIVSAILSVSLFGLTDFSVCSLVIGSFHLLPIIGIDGGNALYALAAEAKDNCYEMLLRGLSTAFTVLLLIFGIIILVITKFNFSCLIMAMILIFETMNNKGRCKIKS